MNNMVSTFGPLKQMRGVWVVGARAQNRKNINTF